MSLKNNSHLTIYILAFLGLIFFSLNYLTFHLMRWLAEPTIVTGLVVFLTIISSWLTIRIDLGSITKILILTGIAGLCIYGISSAIRLPSFVENCPKNLYATTEISSLRDTSIYKVDGLGRQEIGSIVGNNVILRTQGFTTQELQENQDLIRQCLPETAVNIG